VVVQSLYFTKISAKPEIARALEAQYREILMQRSDEATFTRRANAVQKETAIKDNEIQASIKLEEQKHRLVALEGKNKLDAADFERQALEKTLSAYNTLSPDVLRSLGLYEISKKAGEIGTLNITPDLLGVLRG
jgi:hypothetical protein